MTKPGSNGAQGAPSGERPSSQRPGPTSTPLRRSDTVVAPVRQAGSTRGSATPADPLLGSMVGAFRIVEQLGRGGMGSVYLGHHAHIGSKVAIKFLHEALASDEALVQRFFSEARAVNLIGHENIVRIFDFGLVPPRRHYMVMEYLAGHELFAELGQPMRPADAVPVLSQVCDALEAAHQAGIVHRDLKPANIFLIKRAREERFVKVLDFGIAKLTEQTGGVARSAVGAIVGTPEYMAPEQALAVPVDGRSDLYSLGVIAYELLTGRLPFQTTQITRLLLAHAQEVPVAPHVVNPAVPPALSAVVMRALEKKPDRRFQTARDFATALDLALGAAESLIEPEKDSLGVGMFEGAAAPQGFVPVASPLPVPAPGAGAHLGRPSVEGSASVASPVPRIRPVTVAPGRSGTGAFPSDWGRAVPPARVPARSPDGGSEESGRFVARSQATPFAGTSSVTRGSFTGSSPSSAQASIAEWLESEVTGAGDAAGAGAGGSAGLQAEGMVVTAGAIGAGSAVAAGLADGFGVSSGVAGAERGRGGNAGVAAGLADGFVVSSGATGSGSARSTGPAVAAGLADGFVVSSGVGSADSGRSVSPARSPSGIVVTSGVKSSDSERTAGAGVAAGLADGFVVSSGATGSDSGRSASPGRSPSGMVVTSGLKSSDSERTASAGVAAGLADGFVVTSGPTSSDSGRTASPGRSPSGVVVTAGPSSSDSGRALATPYSGSASVERAAPISDSGLRSSPSGRSRVLPPFEATVRSAQGVLGRFTCRDLTKGGLYVCTNEEPPALRSRVVVALPQGEGLTLEAEVVHHVSVAQSASWGLPAGFAVQFAGLTATQREQLDALLQGTPLPTMRAAAADDPELLAVLNRYARAEDGDHYRVLGVALAEDFEPIRLRGLERRAELAALTGKHQHGPKGPALDAAARRLKAAIETLTRPALRLEYDVQRKNHPGVDRCLASTDLTVSAVAAIRKRFLEANPKAESEATVRSVMARSFEQKRQLHQALQQHQEALEADPLHPESQRRYWALKRQLGG